MPNNIAEDYTEEEIDEAANSLTGKTKPITFIPEPKPEQLITPELGEAVQDINADKRAGLNISYNNAIRDDNPDREAEIQQLAKSTGLPPEAIRQNFEQVKQQTKSRQFQAQDMIKKYPHTAKYMSIGNNAKLVTDDFENLQEFEKLVAPFVKPSAVSRVTRGVAGSFVAGLGPTFAQGIYGVGENVMLLADQFVGETFRQITGGLDLPFKTFAEGFGGLRQRAKRFEETLVPEVTAETGRLESAAFMAARSVGLQIPSLGLAVLARDPRVALGAIGVATGGLEAGRALDIGADPVRAAYLGLAQGLTEVVFEAAPVFRLLNDLKVGSTLGKTLLNQLLVEVPSEMATTVVQNFNDWALLNPQKSFSEYLSQLPSDLYDTVLATTMSVGMQTSMLHTVNRFVEGQGEADRVNIQGELLDDMHKLANATQLRERDVDSFEAFVKDAAEDGPMQDVYIDSETLFQSGLDLEGMSDEVKSQMQTGAAIDTPVRIPIEEYAARIAGQKGSQKLLEHLKMNPNDMSRAEAKTFMEERGDELQAEVEKVLVEAQEDELFADSKQIVEDKVFAELEKAARFTADVNRADAILASSFYAVQAERLGITPEAMFEQYPLKVRSTDTPGFSFKIEERGAFAPGERTIVLLKDADLSTYLHEFGHFMLETQFDISIQENAPQEIKDDMDKLLKWFKVEGKTAQERNTKWKSMTPEEKTKSHEQLARGFESYLFTGKAPSTELRKIFQRFRAWLVSIYKNLKNLNVNMTKEVTQVFDRMLATDEAIREAEHLARYEPLFEAAEQANMTPEEFIQYQHLGADATLDAIDDLDTRNLRDMKWLSGARARELSKMQRQAEAKRRQLKAEVTLEVLNEPVYRAMQFLKRGLINNEKIGVGTQHKLSTKFTKQMLGDTAYSVVGDKGWFGKFGLLAEDGMHPDVAAEMFGYTSGDQLLDELWNAEVMKEKIEGITDQRMLEQHGELIDPDAIEVAVMESLKNKTRIKFLAAEVTALNKAAGGRVFIAKAAKQFAEDIINRQQIRSLRPHQYEAAETKAAREKEKAFRKGDLEVAAMNGRNQLINLYAGKGARTALSDVQKGLDYTKKLVRKLTKGRKFLDADIRDQILNLIDQYDMKRISEKNLNRQISFRKWLEAQEAKGVELDIPEEIIDSAKRISYKELTVEEFNGLIDTIKQLENVGKLRNTLLTARQQKDFDKAKVLIIEAIVENAPKKPIDTRTRTNVGGKLKKGNKQFHALHRKMASLLQQMDGREGGPLWEYIVRVVNESGNAETLMREEAMLRLSKMISPVIDKEDIGGKGILYPELGLSLNREEVMSIVLNLGNEGNKQRLLSGEGWSEGQLLPLLNTLSKEETVFIQAVWDHFQSYKSQIAELERKLLGREPEWVEPISVETPHGTLRGGYYPIRYDPERSTAAQIQDDVTEAERMTKNAFVSSTTRRGFTKKRAGKVLNRPLLYSFQTIFQATEEIIHDLTHREMLMDVNKILRDKDIEAAIVKHYGPEALNIVIKSAVQDIAQGNAPAQNILESVVNHLRKGSTIAALAWSVTVSGLQPIGITNSIVRIGAAWVARGLTTIARNPVVTVQQIFAKSSFMRFRPKTLDREINEVQNTIRQPGQVKRQLGKVVGRQNVRRAAELMHWSLFQFIQKTQFIIDVITWQGAYEKQIANGDSDVRASELADQAVIDSQGSGMIKDQSAIQRGSPYQKLWTNFYSFFNLQYNLNADIRGRTKWKNPASVALAARDYALIMVIPAILGQLLRDVLTGGDDDDKWDVEEVAKRLLAEQLSFLLGTMIGIREFAAVAQTLSRVKQYPGAYGGPAGLRIIQSADRLATQVSQGEIDDAFRRAAIDTFAIILHVPGTQVNRTLDGIQAISDGRAGPVALLGGARR